MSAQASQVVYPAITAILLIFHAIVTKFHSPRTALCLPGKKRLSLAAYTDVYGEQTAGKWLLRQCRF